MTTTEDKDNAITPDKVMQWMACDSINKTRSKLIAEAYIQAHSFWGLHEESLRNCLNQKEKLHEENQSLQKENETLQNALMDEKEEVRRLRNSLCGVLACINHTEPKRILIPEAVHICLKALLEE